MVSNYSSFALTDFCDRRIIRKHIENLRHKSSVEREKDIASINAIFQAYKVTPPSLRLSVALSKAQLCQDLFVLSELNFKRGGFFVEFGATNGVELSNTHLLEKQFGWTGILAEPGRVWHDCLRKNRNSAIETRCVWNVTGQHLTFEECIRPEFSTISSFKNSNFQADVRSNSGQYTVETISLNDLLEEQRAPRQIDYLSIDTEGSEFEILSSLDFNRFTFRVITCEHNYTTNRNKIRDLLASHGYFRKHEQLSRFDDWF